MLYNVLIEATKEGVALIRRRTQGLTQIIIQLNGAPRQLQSDYQYVMYFLNYMHYFVCKN